MKSLRGAQSVAVSSSLPYYTENTVIHMTRSVNASELQKNFGRWHDVAQREPVQISKHGRSTAYLISADAYQELLSCYRRSVMVRDLSPSEMALIAASEIDPDDIYELPTPAKQKRVS